jgi:hypothetical protein
MIFFFFQNNKNYCNSIHNISYIDKLNSNKLIIFINYNYKKYIVIYNSLIKLLISALMTARPQREKRKPILVCKFESCRLKNVHPEQVSNTGVYSYLCGWYDQINADQNVSLSLTVLYLCSVGVLWLVPTTSNACAKVK